MPTQDFRTYGITATGSVTARNVPNRLGEFKNVKDWGATGDGVTDDHSFIQNAVDALWQSTGNNRGTVYFPPGVYYVSQPILFQPPGGGEQQIAFVGVGPASKITGNFNGGVIQRLYVSGSGGTGPGSGPVLIEHLWINQDGEFDDTNPTNPVTITAGSHCIFITGKNCTMVRDVLCTTKKHGIGITNSQGWSVYGCSVICTGSTSTRWGIHSSANGTVTACEVDGFTSGIRYSNIGGTCSGCRITNNDIGYEGGPYGSVPSAINQFLNNFLVTSNYFENNGTAFYWSLSASSIGCLIAANSIVGGPDAHYGFRSTAEQPTRGVLMGNTISGDFSIAAITTPSQTAGNCESYIGVSATNSGAGAAWAEEQSNEVYSNVYINSNFTGHAIRKVFAGLPSGSNGNRRLGATYSILDANTAVWGNPVTGGGSTNHVKVRWNGSAWTVVGK
jgi:Pectate lyase superfamily protein